jgi:hypothetical protein
MDKSQGENWSEDEEIIESGQLDDIKMPEIFHTHYSYVMKAISETEKGEKLPKSYIRRLGSASKLKNLQKKKTMSVWNSLTEEEREDIVRALPAVTKTTAITTANDRARLVHVMEDPALTLHWTKGSSVKSRLELDDKEGFEDPYDVILDRYEDPF